MAANSSFSPMQKHDVFLSFRGEDTRDTFTSHLYAALRRKRVGAYIDYRLAKGDEVSPALAEAIRVSKISVIVFSENYASSTWCLDELVHILSCKEENGQLVVPVFYGVDPSHVRKQQGSYAAALAALEERLAAAGIEKLRRWRRALTIAASLSGWDSSVTKPEAELVEEMVKDIVKKLKSMAVRDVEYKGLVGINKRVEKIESLLRFGTPDVRCICIWGMAGIGKTTLARIVFDRLSSEFDGCCFVENIGEKLKMLGREGLKNKVFSTLLDEKASNMIVPGGSTFYASRLRYMKVLIVLDDLKNSQELRHLAGDDDWFGPESRIIVTTRDKQLLRNQIDDDCIYEVEGLDYGEALQLFNLNAFKRNSPTTNCIEISKSVINYCKGNPLALNVLGSYFGGKREEKWKDALDKLKKLPSDEIQNVLKISYDGLDRMQKDIFLDIACFFEGNDRDHVERILDACDFSASIGIDDLVDKSLVTVVNNKLRMHCLLQDMGREIIHQQSIADPGERSRIWLAKDAYNVLSDNTGTPKIEGIFMDMSEINREVYLSPTVFQRMLNLRLLKFYNHDAKKKRKVYLPENLHYLPNMLRYLHWDGYPTKALPANFSAEYLVELIMPNSQVEELWSGVQNLTSLRKIDLSYSKNLRKISNLCEARNLEHLYLEHCGSLSQVPSDFKHLDKLKNLILEGCSSLKVFPELPNNIEYLVLSGTEIEEVPSSIRNLTQLHILSMRDCKRLVSLPTSICKLKLLLSLSLSGCAKLERFPEIYDPMWSLMVLELDNTSIETLPLTIRNLQGIRYFVLEDHKLIPHNVCKFRSSTCLSLLQLKILTDQDSKLPYQFFYEKYCPEIQIASISTSALAQGLDDSRALCGKEFLFYNYVRLPNYINRIDDSSKLKFFHTEIQRRYSNAKRGFLDTDYGVCYSLDTEIPNWFRYRFEDSSSIRIRLDKHGIDTLLGFSVCVAVGFGDNCFDVHRRFRLVCQAHYRLRDGRLLSWDFYWNECGRVTDVLKKKFKSKYLSRSAEGKVRFEFIHDMILPEVVFDFYFVDENNEPIQGCNLKKCGIHLLFEKDFRERFAFFGERGRGDAFKPSGSRVVDFYVEEEEDDDDDDDDGEGGGRDKKLRDNDIVVSIPRRELAQHFDQRVFLFYGFLQLHGRDGMDYLKVKVFDQEMLSQSRFKRVLESSNEDVGAYCQGSEIPNCFEYKCDKPQMWAELPLDLLVDSNLLGFVLCAAVEFKDLNCFNRFKLQYQYGISILHDSMCLTGVCRVKLRDTKASALNYFGGNDDYRAFWNYLRNKHRQEKIGDEQYCISYVWTFKIRCVDENYKPLGDNQCKIRTCSIKHLFADELGSTGSASSTSANRPHEEENALPKTSPNNQDVDKSTMKEKLFNMVRNFIM